MNLIEVKISVISTKMIQISAANKIECPDTYVNQGIKGVRKSNHFFFDSKTKREESFSSRGGRRPESFWKSGGSTASFFLSTL